MSHQLAGDKHCNTSVRSLAIQIGGTLQDRLEYKCKVHCSTNWRCFAVEIGGPNLDSQRKIGQLAVVLRVEGHMDVPCRLLNPEPDCVPRRIPTMNLNSLD